MIRQFKPLDNKDAELIAGITNQVLHHDLKNVTPDGVDTLKIVPTQVQAVYKAMKLYKLAMEKICV